jgi:hypothetical protein
MTDLTTPVCELSSAGQRKKHEETGLSVLDHDDCAGPLFRYRGRLRFIKTDPDKPRRMYDDHERERLLDNPTTSIEHEASGIRCAHHLKMIGQSGRRLNWAEEQLS